MPTNKEAFEDYEGFVEKFKPKRTTDDYFTPPEYAKRLPIGHAPASG